jgi:hypothetical protein
MSGHLLSVLEPSLVLQVNCDAGCPPGVTSDGGKKTRRLGPLSNCSLSAEKGAFFSVILEFSYFTEEQV